MELVVLDQDICRGCLGLLIQIYLCALQERGESKALLISAGINISK